MRAAGPSLTCAVFALIIALLTPQGWQNWATDRLTPAATRIDDRILVLAFSETAAESTFLSSIPHRSAVTLNAITDRAAQGGAVAIVLVGFDGFALTGGPPDRAIIRDSPAVQRLGIGPLLDLTLQSAPGQIPRAVSYRIDDLATEFAGLAVPAAPPGGTVVRTVPAAATVPRLQPGAVVRTDDPEATGTLVLGIAARAAAATSARPTTAAGDRLDVAGWSTPLEDGMLRVRWSSGLDRADDPTVLPAGRALGRAGAVDTVLPAGVWKDRIVLIGTTDPSQTSYYDTPLGPMPELFVHANALNTLLTHEYLTSGPEWLPTIAAAALLACVVALCRHHRRVATVVGLLGAATWVAFAAVLARNGVLVDPLRPTVAAAVLLTALGVATLAHRLAERRRLGKLFSQYVPPDVARELVESGRARLAQAGERLLVTVLFCDLRGFTPIAARLTPADVRDLLDRYYETYSRIVFDHGGTVLQYTGDEIFAVFGAPLPRTDHADAALACARAMHAALPAHNTATAAEDLPDIAFGIGLHSGFVVAAHVGSTIRRQYAIIGDTVNVGSRLCSQARSGDIVWSRAMQDQLRSTTPPVPPTEVTLKGIDDPVTIYRLEDSPTTTAS